MQDDQPETTALACDWLLRHAPPIKCVTLGGSRARGSARPSSDFDIFVFTEDDSFHSFVKYFPQGLVEGLAPLAAVRPPTLTRGFGFQYSAFSEPLGPVDYFLLAPFVIQPFDRFEHHKVIFNSDLFFENKILAEERIKSAFTDRDLMGFFEFRLSSLYTETKRSVLKGELFQSQQALLELRSYVFGVVKVIVDGELFDYTTKGKIGSKKTRPYYDRMNQCVLTSGLEDPAACANKLIEIFTEALRSHDVSGSSAEHFTARFAKLIRSEMS